MNYIQEAILSVLVCAIIGLGILGYVEHRTITDLRDQLQTAENQKSICETANNAYTALVKSQNADIKKLSDAAKVRATSAAKAVADAQAARDKSSASAGMILGQKVDANDCTGAAQVLHSYLQGRPQ